MARPAPFEIERTLPPVLRAVLAACGLFAIALPAWEFRQAFLHPAWGSLFFLVILLGAWGVGGLFLAAALAGEAQRWRFEGGRLTIHHRSLLKRGTRTYGPHDIAAIDIMRLKDRRQSDTFTVRLTLANGEMLETPPYRTAGPAQQMEAKMRLALDLVGRA